MRGAHLDPGSALRAVRDDISKERTPLGMASKEEGRAVQHDVKRGRAGGMTSREGRAVRDGVLLFGVIPGPPQAEPGIQRLGAVTACLARSPRGWRRHLRGARLDPGSALRAVRDDVSKERARHSR